MSPVKASLSVVTRGRPAVWGDFVIMREAGVADAVSGHVRDVREPYEITVDGAEFDSARLEFLEVVEPIATDGIVEMLRRAEAGILSVTGTWHGPGKPPTWSALWQGVEESEDGILRNMTGFQNTPDDAIRDLWWRATVADRLVWDAYGVKGGRREFKWEGKTARWVDLLPLTEG